MAKGQYLFNISDNRLTIKLNGPLTYLNSVSFERFISRIFNKPDFSSILIDLSEATGIDSTNLGLLARIGEESLTQLKKKATIISTSPDINRTLESMGFDTVFRILDSLKKTAAPLKKITSTKEESPEAMASTILEAHKMLMAMNKENEATFNSVVEFMEKDLKKRKK